MKSMMVVFSFFVLLGSNVVHAATAEERSAELDKLLGLVKDGMVRDANEQQQRLDNFISKRNEQTRLLRERKEDLAQLQSKSETMEGEFESYETQIGELEKRLEDRMGTLKELFGVLQQVAGDVKGDIESSPVSSQYPGRHLFLEDLIAKAGSSSQLPSIDELERLWFEMQREMVQSGRIAAYPANFIDQDGKQVNQPVSRVGSFNVISDGHYLNWDAETQQLVELPRQPEPRYLSAAAEFENARPGTIEDFWLDPSGGSLLSLLIQAPDFRERIDQGGLVGYIILALGGFALLLALERLVSLGTVWLKVKNQARSEKARTGNPLGRVMATYNKFQHKDSETLELKLSEAIAQEKPRLTRFVPLLKIISVVAPLLGLLGTVTGMIVTFQQMTLFGTGDPKLMAGGISQALVTTVMGLAVAIPTVLLHTFVNGRSQAIIHLLEERAVGIMAERSLKNETPPPSGTSKPAEKTREPIAA